MWQEKTDNPNDIPSYSPEYVGGKIGEFLWSCDANDQAMLVSLFDGMRGAANDIKRRNVQHYTKSECDALKNEYNSIS